MKELPYSMLKGKGLFEPATILRNVCNYLSIVTEYLPRTFESFVWMFYFFCTVLSAQMTEKFRD